MDESLLNALLKLFAIGALVSADSDNHERLRQIIYDYLKQRLSKDLIEKHIKTFDQYFENLKSQFYSDKIRRKRLSAQFVKVLKLVEIINETLDQTEKIIVLLRLLELFTIDNIIDKDEEDFVSTIAETFNIDKFEYQNIKNFTLSNFKALPKPENLLIITNPHYAKTLKDLKKSKIVLQDNIDQYIAFLFIPSANMLIFKYAGNLPLRLTSKNIIPNRIYIFDSGAIIRGAKIKNIYQTQILTYFLSPPDYTKVTLFAKDIEFFYPNSTNGIHRFTFKAESGQLIGVIGASGAGKSTLINILTGKHKIKSGKITINGYDLYQDKEKLIPLIGYVPQDDLLIEELTVYQNLYYNAQLCFGNLSREQIKERVEKTLKDLDLYDIRHLKVGNPLNKYISGGQRKRLNIALELIREPAILFIDEPTSGLSSMDAEIVMNLIKKQALSGKLVFVNIHQPSSDIYKLFDEVIILDKGGYPVYKGNPLDAIIYFKQVENYVDADIAECPTCGNVKSELILEIIEDKVVNEFGKYTQVRKTTPKEWYILYKVNIEKRTRLKPPPKTQLPKSDFKPPNKLKQFFIFTVRDTLSKLANIQYVLITLLEAPVLAVILAYLSLKPSDSGAYIFLENSNLPVFLFMAVVVALFLALSISAEEIIKDKKILERERFLRLSKLSYLLSKSFILLVISAYQMFIFILLSNRILKVYGLNFQFWLILFSTAAAAAILGLIISASLDSQVAIYITIPLILVPQMLLGGAMINFDDLPHAIRNEKYTPVIADIMFSRWTYEALCVTQFKDNLYERNFFDLDRQKSNASYISSFLIPELKAINNKCASYYPVTEKRNMVDYYLKVLKNEIVKLNNNQEIKHKFCCPSKINLDSFDLGLYEKINQFLDSVQAFYNLKSQKINKLIDKKIDSLNKIYTPKGLIQLKLNNYNQKLAEIVRNFNRTEQLKIYDYQIIRKKDPIFMYPDSRFGRAQFFASVKFLGNKKISTFWFNIAILWLSAILMFWMLYFDLVKKLINLLSISRIKAYFARILKFLH